MKSINEIENEIKALQEQLKVMKADNDNIFNEVSSLIAETPRFIFNKDNNENLFNQFCKNLVNEKYMDAADNNVIVITPGCRKRANTVSLNIAGGNNENPITMTLAEGYEFLINLVGTKDKSSTIIKGIKGKPEIEKVDMEFGFNILDI